MITLWIFVVVVVAGAVAMFATAWHRPDRIADLGAVSHQWIAEHRFGQGRGDTQR